jgi:hypothetical protein
MTKEDLYFLISTILALIALLGVDWEMVLGRVSMNSRGRQILLLILIVGSLAMNAMGWYRFGSVLSSDEWNNYRKEAVVGKSFTQERVLLDGRSFSDCTFDKVTLVFNGTAPFDFVHNTLIPPIRVTSDNPAVRNTLDAAKEFERINRSMGAGTEGLLKEPDQK